MAHLDRTEDQGRRGLTWRGRIAVVSFVALAVSVIWVTNKFLTERFTVSTQSRAEVRQALYSGNLLSDLQRNSVVPLLLSRDPTLISALNSDDYSESSRRLISYVDEIAAAEILLLDDTGRTVAATDRSRLGEMHRNAPYFVNALRSNDTVFTTSQTENGRFGFTYSRRVQSGGTTLGVVAVAVDLHRFEQSGPGFPTRCW
jgi:two-component system C4-dicarboxylate transport sensor histidine kinase DctB